MATQTDSYIKGMDTRPSKSAIDWEIALAQLSSGLAQLLDRPPDSGNVGIYSPRLRQGLSNLAAAMIRAGAQPIHSIPEAIRMLQHPVSSWEVLPHPPKYLRSVTLLDGEYVTEDAEELIVDNPDIAGELTQRIMLRVIENCRIRGDQDGYVRFRKFVIECPVASSVEIFRILNSLDDDNLRMLLNEAYEEVPAPSTLVKAVPTCVRCGWTTPTALNESASRCANRRCLRLEGVQPPRFPGERVWEPGLKRVKAGLARYTTQPGGLELRLYESLAKMKHLRVELWPNYDAYDIGITFPDGEVWAVDCKDSGRPELLAALLSEEDFPMSGYWQRAFYVFPAYRRELTPIYGETFRSGWKNGVESVSWSFEDRLIRMVRNRIRGRG